MTDGVSQSSNSLMQLLPAIYQRDPFLGQFLLAFEKILLGRNDNDKFPYPDTGVDFPKQGIEETIANLATYFDAEQTPDDFLPWLAKWAAFSVRADLPLNKQREFIAEIIRLYRWRGTTNNLKKLLSIFTSGTPEIIELQGLKFQIHEHSTVGKDTYLGGGAPHYFKVIIAMTRVTETVLNQQLQIARALIDLEKPAHTYYDLEPSFPTMQVGVHSTVGVDTLLGNLQQES